MNFLILHFYFKKIFLFLSIEKGIIYLIKIFILEEHRLKYILCNFFVVIINVLIWIK